MTIHRYYITSLPELFKDESKAFLKIRGNGLGLAMIRDPHGGQRGGNCDILKIWIVGKCLSPTVS